MKLVSRVRTLKRAQREAQKRRERTVVTKARDPGSILDFVVETSPHMVRPDWFAPVTELLERMPHESIELCFSAPPRHGKPVAGETLVTMADGSLRPIRDLRSGDRVISGAGRAVTVTAVHDQGELDVLRIRTRAGRELVAERTHGFLAAREIDNRRGRAKVCDGPKRSWIEEWVEAGKLVAQPRRTRARNRAHSLVVRASPARETRSVGGVEIARFLGYIVGDGGVTQRSVCWTNIDPVVRARFAECVAAIGCTTALQSKERWQTLRVNDPGPRRSDAEKREYARIYAAERRRGEPRRVRVYRQHRAKVLLREHGVMGCGAYEKRVPPAVFTAPDDEVAAFLAAYFECDGSRAAERDDRQGQNSHFASVSKELLEGVRTLLARLGIRSNLYAKRGRYNGAPHLSWSLSVLDDARFFDVVPVLGAKAGASKRSRRFEPESASLRDPIVAIEPAGRARCYCITVDRDSSFIANDVVTHNSTLLTNLVAWLLVLEPRLKILYVTYAGSFAEEQIAAAKQIAIAAGVTLGAKQTEKKWTTKAGGSVTAAGMDGQLTGRGFHVALCDDPHKNVGEAHSRRIREGVIRGFRTDVWTRKIPRCDWWPGTSHIVQHTRWVLDDLIGTLSDPKSDHPWPLINLPAVDETGEPLAPALWTREDIERERQIGEYEFAALYLGEPRPIGGTLFGEVATVDALATGGAWRYSIGVDFSRSARARSDFNVAVLMRRETTTGVIEVVDVKREQTTLSGRVTGRGDEPVVTDGFLKTLHALTKEYPTAPVCLYGAKDETQLVSLIASHAHYPVKIRHTLATSKKWLRAQGWAAAWNDPRGIVRLPRHARWFNEYVREHLNFTGQESDGERDDQVDASSSAYDALQVASGGRPSGTGEGSTAHRIRNSIAV